MKKNKSKAMHVSRIIKTVKGKTYQNVYIRQSYRDKNGKVKHRTISNISSLPEEVINMIEHMLKGDKYVPLKDIKKVLSSKPYGHVLAIISTMRKIGLDRVISDRSCRQRNIIMVLIALRIINPCSKLSASKQLSDKMATTALNQLLKIDNLDVKEIYEAMDWLEHRQKGIEKKLADKNLSEGCILLYDVSSTYFEGDKCKIANYGYNRDGKKGKKQIVWGLICNENGCPIGVEVFPGNTSDVTTLSNQIEKIKNQYQIKKVIWISDKGLLTDKSISKEIKTSGFEWITSIRKCTILKLMKQYPDQLELFSEQKEVIAELETDLFSGERIIFCLNKVRREKNIQIRHELIKSAEKELEKIKGSISNSRSNLKNASQIGLRVGSLFERKKVKKYFNINITDNDINYTRNEGAIREAERLDGVYAIRTVVDKSIHGNTDVIKKYKGLINVEFAFRCMKTVDLEVRPVHHRLEERVKAHFLLCMLAYHVEWQMRQKLEPLLYDNKSNSEKNKSISDPNCSYSTFKDLIRHLSTYALNEVSVISAPDISYYEASEGLTEIQQRAFALLEVDIKL